MVYLPLLEPSGKAKGNKIVRPICQTLDRMLVQVVIVVVADQNGINGREVFEPDTGMPETLDATEEKGDERSLKIGSVKILTPSI